MQKNYQRKEKDRGKMISLVEGKYWKIESMNIQNLKIESIQ